MTVSFQCPQCGKQHKVKSELAGKQAKCSCGNRVKIPTPRAAPTTSADAESIAVVCAGCGATHQATPAMAGTKAQCPCGTVIEVPLANVAASDSGSADLPDMSDSQWDDDDFALQPAADPLKNESARSDDEVLSEFVDREPTLAEKQARIAELSAARKMAQMDGGEDESLEESLMSMGSVGGAVVMILAAVWFLFGLKAGVIFFYPPVLFLVGLVALIGGLNDLF